MKAVRSVTDRVSAELMPRLQFLKEQLTAVLERVPEGTSFEELSPEVKKLVQESDDLQALHSGRIPASEFERVGPPLNRLVELTQELDREDLSTLVHLPWRDEVTACIGELHNRVDLLTTALVGWLGSESVSELRSTATSIAAESDDLTTRQVLEGWPTLPEFGPVPAG